MKAIFNIRFLLLNCCLLLLALPGCGSSGDSRPSAQIKGVVTLDGAPLEEGAIHFTSSRTGESTYDNLQAGGTYLIEFEYADLNETYQVTIGPTVSEEMDAHVLEENPPQPMKVKIPKKYTDRTTSGLSVTIEKPGENVFDFDLTKS